MSDFKELVRKRRSYRSFAEEEISAEDVRLILRAALMSPTSKGRRSWQFVVVDDKLDIEKLADAKDAGAKFLKKASLAIAIMDDPLCNDCWIEDCSIAAVSMQYQAEDLGIGSCWAQMRGRGLADGTSADDVIRGILDVPENMKTLCVLGFGRKGEERKQQDEDALKWENVHINKFCTGQC